MLSEKKTKQITNSFKILTGAVFVLSIFLSLTSPEAATNEYSSNPFVINLRQQVRSNTGAGGLFAHDLNQDGDMDFVVTTPGSIGAYDHFGSPLWTITDNIRVTEQANGGTGYPGTHAPGAIAGDMDGDGQQEVAFLTFGGELKILNAQTGVLERSTSFPGAQAIAIANFRGAGDRDAVIQYSQTEIRAINLEDGQTLWHRTNWFGLEHSQVRVADINDDGRDEVVGPIILDSSGNRMNSWDLPGNLGTDLHGLDSIAIADVVPGGPVEIVLAEQGGNDEAIVVNQNRIVWNTKRFNLPATGQCVDEWDPDKVTVGNFDSNNPGLEVFARSSCGRHPWVLNSNGDIISTWNVSATAPRGWYLGDIPIDGFDGNDEGGIDEVSAINWNGDGKHLILLKERHKDGKTALVDAMSGNFLRVFNGTTGRAYGADVAGDHREEVIILESRNSGNAVIKIYSNNQASFSSQANPWTNPIYRRSQQNWNYYSPPGAAGTSGNGFVALPTPTPSGRVIESISPISVQPGDTMTITGTNLSSTIHTFASSTSTRGAYPGSINGTNTQVTWTIPNDLSNDSYTLKVGPTLSDVSNFVLFTLTGSTAPPPTPSPRPTPTPPPTPGTPTIDPSPTIPEWVDCKVLPEDLDLLADWNFWCGITPQQPATPTPGTDPSNPISLPSIGSRGLSAVYNPSSDTFFYIGADQTGVVGASVISNGLSLSGGTFRIDQSGQSPRDPRVIYNKTDDIFLVGWNDGRPSAGRASIYGRIFSSSGEPLTGDFPIMNDKNVSSGDSEYDVNNNVFVVAYGAGGLYLKTVDSSGNLSPEVHLDVLPGSSFAGEVDITVNTNLDEYWITYLTCFSSDDCRVVLKRVSASNLTQVGEDVELNEQRIGEDAFSKPQISYSKFDGAAAVVWLEQGRVNQGGGIYGTMVYDDLRSSGVSAVITPATDPYSEFFDNPVLNNNTWTGAFFLSVSDDQGGVEAVEFIPGSIIVLGKNQVIAPVNESYSNPTHAVYSGGAVVFAQGSANSFANSVNGVSPPSRGSTPTYPSGEPPTPVDTTTLGKMINQIYVWALGLSALLAMLMMVFGGYMVMTAAGNAEQSSKGKDFIWSSIIGMGILFASFLILNTINPDLVNFDLTSINQLESSVPPNTTPPPSP
ncbi:MAG: hypothetical protein Q8P83_03455 [bacterium]|nr:hypothetical protein [bacterium]